MNPYTFDDVMAEIARRGTPPHWIAVAAGVDRRVLEAALDGDTRAMTRDQIERVGGALGMGHRVMEVPQTRPSDDRHRVVEAARRVVADADGAGPDRNEPWVQAAIRAGVDVDAAFGSAA